LKQYCARRVLRLESWNIPRRIRVVFHRAPEEHMNRHLLAAVVAASVLSPTLATAQTTVQTPLAPDAPVVSPRGIKLTAEQTHVIKEIVLKDMRVQPVAANVRVSIGEPVPDSVALQSFPPLIAEKVPEVKAHTFFVKDDQVVIVSQKDKTIADIVK
jgi:hypothetical protein